MTEIDLLDADRFQRLEHHEIPDMRVTGDVPILRSNFIGGIKHLPVAFTPSHRRAPAVV